jgi:hypothetical protein
MPHFNNPIPRSGLPRFHESSTQRSLRDSDSTGRQWHRNAKTTAQESANTRALRLIQQKIESLRRRIVGGAGMIVQPAANSSLVMCKITALHNDYIGVKHWDGTTRTGDEFFAAKDYMFRTSLTSEVVDEITFTYDYDDTDPDNMRESTDGTNTEIEVCYPRYIVGDTTAGSRKGVVWVQSVDHTGVSTVDAQTTAYLEVMPSRVWARRYAIST